MQNIQFEKLKKNIHFNNEYLEPFSIKDLLSENCNKEINSSFNSNEPSNDFPLDPLYVPSYTEILVKDNNEQNLLPLKEEKQLKRI